MSSAYHPQTDGQSERFHRTLEQVLRCYVAPHQLDWDILLSQVAFVLNSSRHSGTQVSPCKVVFGFEPSLPLDHAFS